MWDIFFISYSESNCEQNWQQLCNFHPSAKRLHGIKGIDIAHRTANQLANSTFFWVIDGDNYLIRPLEYKEIPDVDLLMFKTIDPLCDDTTSLGAPKLWRKNSFINSDMSRGDFTLFSVKTKRVLDDIFTIAKYNVTPWETWKTSFRHCVKLMSVILNNDQRSPNVEKYLINWRSTKNHNGENAIWAWRGYVDAEEYVAQHNPDMTELNRINDYVWLKNFFNTRWAT